ncbi:unnamed protein product [Phytomonas sp. EM1]|nr:unnamed protein product [Phytomonas sp. EM1]|eukprot:CCW60902.1 unnamed protein product [Phytomonas sp. isolate EM1]
MLSGCWLLSDLDGTLISTPHKAQGKYPSITQSPCFDPIRRWLMNGGSVCIITTADLRTLSQVYFPLQPYLAQGRVGSPQQDPQKSGNSNRNIPKTNNSHALGTTLSSTEAYQPGKNVSSLSNENTEASEPFGKGSLLLSLYSGAALYRCTSNSVELLTDYVNSIHFATPESTDMLKSCKTLPVQVQIENKSSSDNKNVGFGTANCVQGTCINRGVSKKLLSYLTNLYERFIFDLLSGEPVVVSASLRLSRRYQMMWIMILRYLDDIYQSVHPERLAEKPILESSKDFAAYLSTMRCDAEAVLWKMRYLRSRPDLLICLGVLRVEYIVDTAFSSVAPASLGQCKLQESKDQALLIESVKSLLLKDLPQDMNSRAEAFASHMIHALGVDPGCLRKRHQETDSTLVDVAQVIVLGIPLGLFSRYFVKSIPEFARIGVNIMPQPNSVVFSKLGINKSTTVQYLLGENVDRNRSFPKVVGVGSSPSHRGPCGPTPVCSAKILALGDNPHTTDHGLTVFRKVRFISVEKMSQREERHQRIERRLNRTRMLERLGEKPRMPDGSTAPSFKELVASLTKCGPLMDDRLFPNIAYVGNEEDGTAIFLTTLMDELNVPPFNISTKLACKAGATPVDPETFTEALSKAVELASCEAQAGKTKSNL